jgi:hypothetical protein
MAKTKLNDEQKSDAVDLTSEVVGVLPIQNGGIGLNSVSGQNDKFLKVNAAGTGLEFATTSGGGISEADAIALAVAL